MVFKYKNHDKICSIITVDYKTEKVSVTNYTDNFIFKAFGNNENPTMSDFNNFLESRCFPRTRDNLKMHLRELGLDYYDPLSIVKKTKGILEGDYFSLEIKE